MLRRRLLLLVVLSACREPTAAPTLEDTALPVQPVEVPPTVWPPLAPGESLFSHSTEVPREQKTKPATAQVSVTMDPPAMRQIGELRAVKATVTVLGGGPTALTMEFIAPSGQVFNRQEGTAVEGEARQTEFSLPVAGTLIDSSALTGTWRARVFFEGRVVGENAFEVLP